MSGRNTKVPSVITAPLPVPVVADEYARCPVTDVLRLLGDKWTVLVIVLLGKRPYRYNELHRGIQGISQRMLTRTLRDLEQDGIVRRTVFPTVPPSVEYSITELGQSLLVPLSAVADWAVDHHAEIAAARQSPNATADAEQAK